MKEDNYTFQWKDIGDIGLGRPNLGDKTHVSGYRLMLYTMRSVLNNDLGASKANELFYKSGFIAGKAFCSNVLDTKLEFFEFIAQLQEVLKDRNAGILRVEKSDPDKKNFIVTVAEDIACSGLPVTNETVCDYDEGYLAGVFSHYYGLDFEVKEIDCWSTGDRVCRFSISLKNG